jgi:hypothetical protein
VTDLNKIVHLHSATQNGVRHSAINRAVRAYLAIVFDNHSSPLKQFHLTAFFIRDETESVRAYDRARMNDDAVSDKTVIVDRNIRMNDGVVAYATPVADDHSRMKSHAIPDFAVAANRDSRMN